MIKRIRLIARPPGVTPAVFTAWCLGVVAGAALAGPDARPSRITASMVLPELSDPGDEHADGHDGIATEWFTSEPHLARFESWLAALPDLTSLLGRPDDSSRPDDGPRGSRCSHRQMGRLVVAREHALRGEPWLARRWRDGGGRLKHMALVTRAGLSAEEFSRRWRAHAGTAGSSIPAEARGCACVQNHPMPGEWPYDAINEVYFDDLAGLRARVRWFRDNVPGPADGGLFGQSRLIAVREVVLYP